MRETPRMVELPLVNVQDSLLIYKIGTSKALAHTFIAIYGLGTAGKSITMKDVATLCNKSIQDVQHQIGFLTRCGVIEKREKVGRFRFFTPNKAYLREDIFNIAKKRTETVP